MALPPPIYDAYLPGLDAVIIRIESRGGCETIILDVPDPRQVSRASHRRARSDQWVIRHNGTTTHARGNATAAAALVRKVLQCRRLPMRELATMRDEMRFCLTPL
jgi:hypothetical protein